MPEATQTVAFRDDDVLSCDPFEGDYGGAGDNDGILRDKIVRANKRHVGACHLCGGDIEKGARHRSRSEVYDGDLMHFRWCPDCCAAMAAVVEPGRYFPGIDDDDAYQLADEAWDRREALGQGRRAAAAASPAEAS